MTVIKRDKAESTQDLIEAIEKFNILLEKQGEDAAVADLREIVGQLKTTKANDPKLSVIIEKLLDCFDGDHALSAYTIQREGASNGEFSEADQLFLASSRVLSLARRFTPTRK